MGISLAKIWKVFQDQKQMRVIMVGLDNAGKTTALFKLQLGEVVLYAQPTIGFNVETVEYMNTTFTVWDMGGQDKTRVLWRYYYEGVQAIIYVVDSGDRARLPEAANELRGMLQDELLRDAVLCILANKQDLPNAMTIREVSEGLGLHSLPASRKWHIQATVAMSGEGLLDAFSWLSARAKELS